MPDQAKPDNALSNQQDAASKTAVHLVEATKGLAGMLIDLVTRLGGLSRQQHWALVCGGSSMFVAQVFSQLVPTMSFPLMTPLAGVIGLSFGFLVAKPSSKEPATKDKEHVTQERPQ